MRKTPAIMTSAVVGFFLVFGFQNCGSPVNVIPLNPDGTSSFSSDISVNYQSEVLGKVICDSESPYYGRDTMALKYCLEYLELSGDSVYLADLKEIDFSSYKEFINNECLVGQTLCELKTD